MTSNTSISADTETGREVRIRVEGKGSFQCSPALREFSRKMIEEGRREFIIDLKDCPAMDSTFMGTLAGIATRIREAGGGDLWVVNRNERNSELLAGLGLDVLFSEKPAPVELNGGKAEPIHYVADKDMTRAVMPAPEVMEARTTRPHRTPARGSMRLPSSTRSSRWTRVRCRRTAGRRATSSAGDYSSLVQMRGPWPRTELGGGSSHSMSMAMLAILAR